jgi:formylglycine-generating enzyme required for sulfatase activity
VARKDDLEQSIRESYEIIREYEAILRMSIRPEEKARATRQIREHWSLIEQYGVEYRLLVEDVLPEDIAQILASSGVLVGPSNMEDLLRKARTHMINGNLGRAIQLLQAAERRQPMYPGVYELKHEVLAEASRPYVTRRLTVDEIQVLSSWGRPGRPVPSPPAMYLPMRGRRWVLMLLLVVVIITSLIIIIIITRCSSTGVSAPTPSPTSTLEAGATRIRERDDAVMMYVPAGEFLMGSSDEDIDAVLAECSGCRRDQLAHEQPQHKVTVGAFWIDRTEVTNAQYRQCVGAGECSPPQNSNSETRPDYYDNSEYDDYPVVYVTWQQARDYAEWVDGRLCTEAEWEYAARGPEAFTYPWGESSPNDTLLNYHDHVGDTAKVGSYSKGESWCYALDMAGNVWEWTQSLYADYPYVPDDGREDLETDGERVVRGGAYDNAAMNVRCSARGRNGLAHSSQLDGFRVCIPAKQN